MRVPGDRRAQADMKTVVADMLSGQYRHPLRVVAFNTAEGWARDVSADIACFPQSSSRRSYLAHGRAASFAMIARREGKGERHIRLLAPLAFISPRIVSALLDGTAPANLTLTQLVRALPYSWAEQERRVGTSVPFCGLVRVLRNPHRPVSATGRQHNSGPRGD